MTYLYRVYGIIEMMSSNDIADELISRTATHWKNALKNDSKYYSQETEQGIPLWQEKIRGSVYCQKVTPFLTHLFLLLEDPDFKSSFWLYITTIISHAIDYLKENNKAPPAGINIEELKKLL
jgi:hypothetical protein